MTLSAVSQCAWPPARARTHARRHSATARRCSAKRRGRSSSGAPRVGARSSARRSTCPTCRPEELLPARLRRAEPPRLPEVSEPEIVRHYVRLSKRNFDLDSGFYPLGSCTMKHNPRLHERVAALPGHARLHPLQDPERAQGALELMWNLERALAEISGLPHVSLQPSAGSHGELAGVLLTRAYHEDRGETRHKVLTPDTAHGTNPATVTMAGFEVVKLATNADGGVDLDDLRAKADADVACLMLTNPNTLGLFDPNIRRSPRSCTAWARRCTTTARTSTPSWGSRARATWASTSSTSTCTSPSPSPTAAAARGRGRSPCPTRIEPFLPVPVGRAPRPDGSFELDRQRLARRQVDRPPARLPGQLRLLRARLRLHLLARRRRAQGRLRDGGPERQLPARAPARAGRRGATCRSPTASSACTSSCSPAAR